MFSKHGMTVTTELDLPFALIMKINGLCDHGISFNMIAALAGIIWRRAITVANIKFVDSYIAFACAGTTCG
jgi:hypothetical protein